VTLFVNNTTVLHFCLKVGSQQCNLAPQSDFTFTTDRPKKVFANVLIQALRDKRIKKFIFIHNGDAGNDEGILFIYKQNWCTVCFFCWTYMWFSFANQGSVLFGKK